MQVAIIGGGPAGLMAAETLSALGHAVTVYDGMPTVGRKFLLAGKSGLNLTHSEDVDRFATRYGPASAHLAAALAAFGPEAVQAWANGLGTDTFVGSSGRIFPTTMKASPLLRAWLGRLAAQDVAILPRHRWTGFAADGGLQFDTPDGPMAITPDATVLALGGASWPRLGSDAAWIPWLASRGVGIRPFQPANCGFNVEWSAYFSERYAGEPVKSVTASSAAGSIQGEFVVTRTGIEGSLVYAHAAALRDALAEHGAASLTLDLAPGRTAEQLSRDFARQPSKASFSNRLRKGTGLSGVKAGLLHEYASAADLLVPDRLAARIKALSVPVTRTRPIAEAISSAGGIAWDSVDEKLMLKALPGVFVAGEMIDWEAPTGGYLLTACFASGRAAAAGVIAWASAQ